MLNFFFNFTIVPLFLIASIFFFLKKFIHQKNNYDTFFFLFESLSAVSVILVFTNLENYLGFLILSELSAVFLLTLVLLKECFFFKKKTPLLTLLVFFFINFDFFSGSCFSLFDFFKKNKTTSDFFKLFYFFNNYTFSAVFLFFVLFFNFFIFFYFKKKTTFGLPTKSFEVDGVVFLNKTNFTLHNGFFLFKIKYVKF